jgi:hypothetical protein
MHGERGAKVSSKQSGNDASKGKKMMQAFTA